MENKKLEELENKEHFKEIKWVVVVLLSLAVFSLPYGYYMFLKIVVTGIAGYLAFKYIKEKKMGWFVVMGLIAILFNPIIPIYLNRDIWVVIDIIVAIIFLINIFLDKLHEEKINKLIE